MPGRQVVRGQRIRQVKLARAKELRRRMTPEEAILWAELRGNRLSGLHFRRQQVIQGLVVDFYSNDPGLVIEIDGPIHLLSQEDDQDRDRMFEDLGLKVLHFTNEAVRLRLPHVLREIRKAAGHRRYPAPPLESTD